MDTNGAGIHELLDKDMKKEIDNSLVLRRLAHWSSGEEEATNKVEIRAVPPCSIRAKNNKVVLQELTSMDSSTSSAAC
ncbi:UNVERIFIED_CONTAM: hypothetical protein Sindi_0461900 [Sesamum indicum]